MNIFLSLHAHKLRIPHGDGPHLEQIVYKMEVPIRHQVGDMLRLPYEGGFAQFTLDRVNYSYTLKGELHMRCVGTNMSKAVQHVASSDATDDQIYLTDSEWKDSRFADVPELRMAAVQPKTFYWHVPETMIGALVAGGSTRPAAIRALIEPEMEKRPCFTPYAADSMGIKIQSVPGMPNNMAIMHQGDIAKGALIHVSDPPMKLRLPYATDPAQLGEAMDKHQPVTSDTTREIAKGFPISELRAWTSP